MLFKHDFKKEEAWPSVCVSLGFLVCALESKKKKSKADNNTHCLIFLYTFSFET